MLNKINNYLSSKKFNGYDQLGVSFIAVSLVTQSLLLAAIGAGFGTISYMNDNAN